MRKMIAGLIAVSGLALSSAALADPPGKDDRHGGPHGHWRDNPPHAQGHGPRFDHGHDRRRDGPRNVIVVRQPAHGYYAPPPPPPPVYYAPRVPVVSILGVPVVTFP
ncbi:hypothetical protein [Phytohalomonas tamaricis]|uniref:hypothetical protein n=1 Tax=Phytohalomonas tamaricis TaxID=2081032 RepID=UPI000D0AED12|nr:hypothetical protein [Phytohalomonas tamaricis]